jgi:hypothetical protein
LGLIRGSTPPSRARALLLPTGKCVQFAPDRHLGDPATACATARLGGSPVHPSGRLGDLDRGLTSHAYFDASEDRKPAVRRGRPLWKLIRTEAGCAPAGETYV